MKLNNRGWGLHVMMIFVLILMICLVIISALINKNFKDLTTNTNSSYNYTTLENKVEEAAQKYIKQKQIIIDSGKSHTITVSKLQKEGILDTISDGEVKCTGYSIVENKNNKLIYNVYIRCGSNYKTKNYSSILDM